MSKYLTPGRFRALVTGLACMREFGPVPGARIFFQLYGKSESRIRLPGYRQPLLLRGRRADGSDVTVFDKVFLQREYDHPLGNSDPAVIVDAGAFIGCSAVFFAHKYPAAKIIALEPDPSNFERLVINSSQYPNIHPIQAALWHTATWITMTNFSSGHAALRITEAPPDRAGAVPTLTLPQLMAAQGLDHIDLLKLDIEGAEEQLFEPGCQAWLDKVSAIMIELHDWVRPGPSLAFYRAISQYSFEQHISGENIVILK